VPSGADIAEARGELLVLTEMLVHPTELAQGEGDGWPPRPEGAPRDGLDADMPLA
jgi:hypothetical protein